jgi:Dyp-type peroxidase family
VLRQEAVAIDLNKPLAWKNCSSDEQMMLQDLQGNILKAHGRSDSILILLRFDRKKVNEACDFLRKLSQEITSAQDQLEDAENYRATRIPNRGFLSILLSSSGYQALKIPADKIPHLKDDLDTIPFFAGMKNRALRDPEVGTWDQEYRDEIHAMVILADTDEGVQGDKQNSVERQGGVRKSGREKLDEWSNKIINMKSNGLEWFHIERGHTWRNEKEQVVEHFGFADGISKINLLQEDIDEEIERIGLRSGNPIYWNPYFPLRQVLVKDPGSPDEFGYGSYVVYRKLEQNVRAFREQELDIAAALGLSSQEADQAGALIFGRYRDGSSVLVNNTLRPHLEYKNNFSYSGDERGERCPFHAHIRKVNSRNQDGLAYEDVRSHLLVRRSMTYGDTLKIPSEVEDLNDLPEEGVGVLFLAYQRSIRKQFEYIQANWANLPNNGGPDPLIGQWGMSHNYTWTNGQKQISRDFRRCVKLKGGEYFFAPSIRFLQSLKPDSEQIYQY